MNAHKLIAAVIAAATLPLLPGCTTVTAGRADLNRAEWLEAYDERVAAEDAERKTATTTAATPSVPVEYAELSGELRKATAGIKAFWHRQGVDLSATKVTLVDDASHAPCGTNHGVAEADGWTCRGGIPEVVLYLPMVRERTDIGGDGYAWFLVGHELGHVLDNQNGITSVDRVGEAFADCLSGASAAGSGMGAETKQAVDAVYPTSTARHNSVSYGIERGYQACIDGAK